MAHALFACRVGDSLDAWQKHKKRNATIGCGIHRNLKADPSYIEKNSFGQDGHKTRIRRRKSLDAARRSARATSWFRLFYFSELRYAMRSAICGAVKRGQAIFCWFIRSSMPGPCVQRIEIILMSE